MAKIAVIRVRGEVKKRPGINETMDMLRLYNKNYCVVVEDTPQNIGMINKVKDFVTYGLIDENTFKELVEKRGEEYKGPIKDSKGKIDYNRKYFELNGKRYRKFFRLAPPRNGYRSIKKPFLRGGALGNRKEKINGLIRRMI